MGLDFRRAQAKAKAALQAKAARANVPAAVAKAFAHFDKLDDERLGVDELLEVLDWAGYEVDEAYASEAIAAYGSQDAEGVWWLDLRQFGAVATHLDLVGQFEELEATEEAAEAERIAAAATAADHDDERGGGKEGIARDAKSGTS
eukprot:SAG31_NODE_24021_length_491_cov_0.543367_1_plen_145_part_10